jgi:hypothetical protein
MVLAFVRPSSSSEERPDSAVLVQPAVRRSGLLGCGLLVVGRVTLCQGLANLRLDRRLVH